MDPNMADRIFSGKLSFWDHLTESQKNLFCAGVTVVRCEKGKNIQTGTEDCIGLLQVKSGQLRTYLLSERGKEVTLYRLFEGDVCVLSAPCVLNSITFDVMMNAEEDTELWTINAKIFQQLMDESIYVRCFAYHLATVRFSDVMWVMQQILFMDADGRLAMFLLNESARNNSCDINLTREQIAYLISSAREVVSRLIKYFVSEGILQSYRGGVRIVDMDKLKSHCKL